MQHEPSQTQRKAEYEAYLRTAAWQTKRQVALERAGHACQLCNSTKRLDVHHRTYERFGGAELDEDLTVLCRSCHDHFHGSKRVRPRQSKPKAGHGKKHPNGVKAEERTRVFDAMVPGREYRTAELAERLGLKITRTGSILASLRRSLLVTRNGKKWRLRKPPQHLSQQTVARAELHEQLEREVEQRINAHVVPIKNTQVDAA